MACVLATAPLSTSAEDAAELSLLDKVVISATRSPQDPKHTPVAVTVLPLADLDTAQVFDLRAALAEQAGVHIVTSGAKGAVSSLFLRGAESHQTTFFVDGVRINDRSALYTSYLGGADLTGVERIEVLRGPQSTLYGSSAMGGVILIETARGRGAPQARVRATAGSFETQGASLAVTGARGAFGYTASMGYTETENDRPNNAYDQWSYSARGDYTLSDRTSIGITYRGQEGESEEPGSTIFPSPGLVDFTNHLITVFGEFHPTEQWHSRLTAARHLRNYNYTSSWGSSPADHERDIIDWHNTYAASAHVEVVAGVTFEDSTFTGSGVQYNDAILAGYLTAVMRPVEPVTLTVGVRRDDYDTVGQSNTWRAAAAWRVWPDTKLRTSYGTAFTAPSSEDYLGVPNWGQLPNLALRPERARGWDLGIEQELAGGMGSVSLTYFQGRYRDKFSWQVVDWTFYTGQIVNINRASTAGVELALAARPHERLNTRLTYTYLDTEDKTTGDRLIRRPRHTLNFDANVQVTQAWLLGAGVHMVSDRLDSGPVTLSAYQTVRFYTNYALGDGKPVLQLRVENAFDETYEETAGYPALPVAVYGGLEWRF